ncbi:hypothetical protein [Modicisalibacter luteus]|uniref:Uncharacterized protein n=1 Tax=Modicisalibacter luteus TaxID=453962 RepID=A0ABV7M455_9GAMM|nr:hypothetical protein [Halomonas lutea]GHA88660.1 hypothetical protein GCM10007159_07640 [Halomonas lutea]
MAKANGIRLSHECINSLILNDKIRGGDFWQVLRQPEQRCDRHLVIPAGLGKIPHHMSIEHRPAEVEDRLLFGYWEGDTVLHASRLLGVGIQLFHHLTKLGIFDQLII